MKISIAMAYYNRRPLLLSTLQTIAETKFDKNELEVVIVDDHSTLEHSIDDIPSLFEFKIKVIKLHTFERFWIMDVLATNVALNNCDGKYIILQNPECIHIGDLISDAYEKLSSNENIYYSFNTLSADENLTNLILNNLPLRQLIIKEHLNTPSYRLWYNHIIKNFRCYHFTCCASKASFIKIGGFDLKFIFSNSYADDDFVRRIRLANIPICGQNYINEYDILSVHLNHSKTNYVFPSHYQDGLAIFNNIRNNDIINPNLTYNGEYKEKILEIGGFVA